MKNQLRLVLSLLLLSSFAFTLASQALNVAIKGEALHKSEYGDSTFLQLKLDALPPVNSAEKVTPFYKSLFIYGDGDFRYLNFEQSGEATHLYYNAGWFDTPQFHVRSYSTGMYGGGSEPPPDNLVGPIIPPTYSNIQPYSAVDAGRYLKILRNTDVQPGDTLVNIVSLKNPSTNPDAFMSGQLVFLYDGKMRVVPTKAVAKDAKNGILEMESDAVTELGLSQFDLGEHLFHRPDVNVGGATSRAYVYPTFGSLAQSYGNSLIFSFDDIAPGDEVRFFIELSADATQMSLLDDTKQIKLDFAAVLSVNEPSGQQGAPLFPSLIPENLLPDFTKLKADSFLNVINSGGQSIGLSSAATLVYEMADDTSRVEGAGILPVSLAANVVDYYTSTAVMVSSHDPNFMRMEACECPAAAERYQLFTTVQCENSGYGPTSKIEIDITLPPGISADDIAVDPISYFPTGGNPNDVKFVKVSDNQISWQMDNFVLFGTPVRGLGDPSTYATIHFNMYSSVKPDELDPIQACIRFDGKPDAICTLPATVSAASNTALKTLNCGPSECADDPNSDTSWPWWYWLILILLFLLILLMIFLRRARN